MGEKVDTPIGRDTEFKKFAAVQMLLWIAVAIVVIAILLLLGPAIGNIFSTIINAI